MTGSVNVLLTERLGTGGHAEVWRASRTDALGVEFDVAVKLVSESMGPEEKRRARLRLADEAAILAVLAPHPNIVGFHGLVSAEFEGRERLGLVLELVRGPTLASLFKARRVRSVDDQVVFDPLPVPAVVHVLRQTLEALQFVRELDETAVGGPRKIIHRDLKPGNLMLDGFGDVRLLDFGIAKASEQQAEPTGCDPQAGHAASPSGSMWGGMG